MQILSTDIGSPFVQLVAVVSIAGLLGCGSGKKDKQVRKFEFPLEITAQTESGKPVAGAPVMIDGKEVGKTDRDGKFVATLRESSGKKTSIKLGDMDAYKYVNKPSVEEKLRTKKNVTSGKLEGVPITLDVSAKSLVKEYLVWVALDCGSESMKTDACRGVPVMVDDEKMTETTASGKAHFVVRKKPGTKLNVKIPTDQIEGDDIKPSSLVYNPELGLNSQVLYIEEKITDGTRRNARQRRRQRRIERNRARRKKRRQKRQKQKKRAAKQQKKKKESSGQDSDSSGSDNLFGGGGGESSGGSKSKDDKKKKEESSDDKEVDLF